MDKTYSDKVLCFGELLFRISLDTGGDWLSKGIVPFYMGGAELNVATALALWEIPSQYFTVLPDNYMSKQIVAYLQCKHIDSQKIHYGGNRVGTYYLVNGADLKNDSLIYDRAGSAFAGLKAGTINWDSVFNGVGWLHFSAICPALNQNVADVCQEALEAAVKRNITISIDLNFRSKLWQYGKQPFEVMPDLVKYCDLVMGNIWAAETMLGIPVDTNVHKIGKKSDYVQAALKTSETIGQKYPKCKAMANTFRFDTDGGINYYTTLYTGGHYSHTENHSVPQIKNKVGSGDCFMAGLIYGFYNSFKPDDILRFATMAALDKLSLQGDTTTHTVSEIKKSSQMSVNQPIINSILQQGMLPLYYHEDGEVSLEVLRTLYRAGIRVIEYTNRGPAALENFRLLKKKQGEELPGLHLGIGTIKTEQEAHNFIVAGADFIVSPIINPAVGEITNENGLTWCPGCMTPTEIYLAHMQGAALVKLFPANILGIGFMQAIKEIFPGKLFMPTGGVEMNAENISEWFKAGVCAVGIGSKLITKNILTQKLYEDLYVDTVEALKLVHAAKQNINKS